MQRNISNMVFKILLFTFVTNIYAFDHQYKNLDKLLQKYVQESDFSSKVYYKKLKQNMNDLTIVLKEIEGLRKSDFNHFTKEQKLAYLINAYNIFTIKLIVDHYPVKSIKDIGSFFSSPWNKRFFKIFRKKSSLDKIEHKMIRKWFNEPRIHFAVVCASIGCPALSSKAYLAETLNTQLENGAIKFLNDPSRNKVNLSKNKLELSSIFKWYGDDFKKTYGSFQEFIALRITKNSKVQTLIRTNKMNIEFNSYNWNLNEIK